MGFPQQEHTLTKLKRKKDGSTIIVGNVNIALSIMNKTTRQEIIKVIEQHYNLIKRNLKNIPFSNYRIHIPLK